MQAWLAPTLQNCTMAPFPTREPSQPEGPRAAPVGPATPPVRQEGNRNRPDLQFLPRPPRNGNLIQFQKTKVTLFAWPRLQTESPTCFIFMTWSGSRGWSASPS